MTAGLIDTIAPRPLIAAVFLAPKHFDKARGLIQQRLSDRIGAMIEARVPAEATPVQLVAFIKQVCGLEG